MCESSTRCVIDDNMKVRHRRVASPVVASMEKKPFVRRVRQLERPRCLRQGAACARAKGVQITEEERVQRSAGRPRRSRQCVIVCASRGVQGVASLRSSACVVEELDVCRR
jgi:hypothetical protein